MSDGFRRFRVEIFESVPNAVVFFAGFVTVSVGGVQQRDNRSTSLLVSNSVLLLRLPCRYRGSAVARGWTGPPRHCQRRQPISGTSTAPLSVWTTKTLDRLRYKGRFRQDGGDA
jgi:hypothetical protein